MFGTILKYTAVLALGGIGFAFAGNWMDEEVISGAKTEIENYRAGQQQVDADELKALTEAYIVANRQRWVDSLTFAGSIKHLDESLNAYK